MLNIGGLNQGVVIDHIKAGHSMEIYQYLNLEKLDCSVAIIKNARSNKMGKRTLSRSRGLSPWTSTSSASSMKISPSI